MASTLKLSCGKIILQILVKKLGLECPICKVIRKSVSYFIQVKLGLAWM